MSTNITQLSNLSLGDSDGDNYKSSDNYSGDSDGDVIKYTVKPLHNFELPAEGSLSILIKKESFNFNSSNKHPGEKYHVHSI